MELKSVLTLFHEVHFYPAVEKQKLKMNSIVEALWRGGDVPFSDECSRPASFYKKKIKCVDLSRPCPVQARGSQLQASFLCLSDATKYPALLE
ncbi:unnamed protein product [Nesidiocoris tenuis]|uniref:Uncharacterized protein n=1 Tax=Nesidiocoris tenuis TaxID=355587 RepID=A0A6H5H7P8_9HEMI|nr:unnamed protein product [Nesidiocoris tenuis]